MWNKIADMNTMIGQVVWGVPMLIFMLGVGLYLTCKTNFIQFRKFGFSIRNTIGKIFQKQEAGNGEITPVQAVMTALAATVGIGNIAGITWAITMGGPGVLFWLWISALIGMCTKYAEVVLSLHYRERNATGEWVGGPMYYIRNGLGKKWNWMAILFSCFGALTAFGIGNAVQVGNITDAVDTAIRIFCPETTMREGDVNWILGSVLAMLTAFVLFGGVKRIGKVTERLVPFMAAIYIISCMAVILVNIEKLVPTLISIWKGAFQPKAVVGGVGGFTLLRTVTWGIKRGVFSNEAGLGSAPIVQRDTP